MIDFNKELEFARLADEFIEAFVYKTGMVDDNNISMEDFAEYIRVNSELDTGLVTCNFESDIKNIHFQIFIEVNNVTLQQIIDQTAEFLFITVYHYTDEDDFDDCDENFYVEFTSPDFRFLKQLKNTIRDILRKHNVV